MITEWARFWRKRANEAERNAHRFRDYPELAEQYFEEAAEIQDRFLADAVIVEDPTNATIEAMDMADLAELEKRYLDGDR
jgi:hypothetical protein